MFFSFLIFSLLGPRLLQFDSTAINQIGDRKVKIKYKFANETVEIEVTEEWGSNQSIDINFFCEYLHFHAGPFAIIQG